MTTDETTGQLVPTGRLIPTGRKMLVLKAFTTAAGKWDSSIVTYEYVIDDSVPDPDKASLTYDLNGGTYKGSADNIVEVYKKGTVIKIHKAPVRKGYRFLYWKGSKYQPGDTYEVTEDHTFVAQWKKETDPDGKDKSDGDKDKSDDGDKDKDGSEGDKNKSEDSKASSNTRTGDESSIMLWAVTAGLAALAAGMISRKRKEDDE